MGLSKSLRVMQRESAVINHCAGVLMPTGDVPRFRAVHEEVVKLDIDFGTQFAGVLTDSEGRVRALWASYSEAAGGSREEREWCAGLSMEVGGGGGGSGQTDISYASLTVIDISVFSCCLHRCIHLDLTL